MKRRKVKKRDREINRDVSIAVDIILFKLERIEQKLDENMQTEPEQSQAIILNLNQRQGGGDIA